MRVLVTGGAGSIGRHLVRNLLKNKRIEVVVIDDLSSGSYQDLYNGIDNSRLTLYEIDIRNVHAVREVFEKAYVDVCVHLAARKESVDSGSVYSTNVEGTHNLLTLSSRAGTRGFVYASSAAVYGNSRSLPASEKDPPEPISDYAKSKLFGEQLVEQFSNKFSFATCLRIFNVYGVGQTSGVIPSFIRRISQGLPPIMYGDGNQTRDFVSVEDVIRSIKLAAGLYEDSDTVSKYHSTESEKNVVLNIGTGVPTTILKLSRLINEFKFGDPYSIGPIHENPRVSDIFESYAETSTAMSVLCFRARDDLRTGLVNLLSKSPPNVLSRIRQPEHSWSNDGTYPN